jgi:hypothetical protein
MQAADPGGTQWEHFQEPVSSSHRLPLFERASLANYAIAHLPDSAERRCAAE